ncbi:MAG: LysR family transcriptional regulator [Pseudomonadota bacterium]
MKAPVKHLDELSTAYVVAKLGTVSAAAKHLGVHRATIMRRIDNLEANLGGKVFLRHSRGYSITDLGREVMHSGERIENELRRLMQNTLNDNSFIEGELKIASNSASPSQDFILSVQAFRNRYQNVFVKYATVDETPKLEFGDAHIYLHVGEKLESPDYVHVPWQTGHGGIYGSNQYFSLNGNPTTVEELERHAFAVLACGTVSPHDDWLRSQVPEENIVLVSDERLAIWHAIMAGLSIGYLPDYLGRNDARIEPVLLPVPELKSRHWAITHMDYHRSAKIQAFFRCARESGLIRRPTMDPGQDCTRVQELNRRAHLVGHSERPT